MKKYISIILGMFLIFAVHGQSADTISEILGTEHVTVGQVCYLSAVEQGLMSERDSYADAVVALIENGQIQPSVNENDLIPANDITFIMSKMWDINGGLMFRLSKGSPRYAFKQFKADRVIGANVEPTDYLSGRELLSMYTTCLRIYGEFNIAGVSMENE